MTEYYLCEDEARAYYTAGDAAHDFDHVLRVTRLGARIAAAEGADVDVVRLAALLHDIPVIEGDGQPTRIAHHMAAAEFAQRCLATRGLSPQKTAAVVHCIEAHRFRDQSIQPATLEARCLYDADKLDSIGAIGVGRAFAFAGAHNSRLWREAWTNTPPDDAKPVGREYTPTHEFVYKLSRLQATLYTNTAQSIARERHKFMVAFFDQLDAEMLDLL